jgi:hypothetical protein
MHQSNLLKLIAVGWCVCLVGPSFAYEVKTHEDMSEQAVLRSKIRDILPVIGLKTTNDLLTYIDSSKSVAEWVISGANDEDDNLSLNPARYRNHFYDPLTGLGLHGVATGAPSPDWGLEDTRSFATQLYSLKHARQYYYDALTLTNKDNREQWMARTFYTLGHIIHLIQDAAQPQHTRNDSHGGGPFGSPSLYEKWTDDVRLGLPYLGYSDVIFDTARKFWTGGTNGDGRGIADFSNRNFVTAGTNFDNPVYPRPVFSPSTEHDEPANSLLSNAGVAIPPECLPPNDPCVMTFYRNPVDDAYRPVPNVVNDKTSTWSIFDQDLKINNQGPAFSLNRFNFEAAYPFLIPKAVGYSAGLIDYFFRGRLEGEDVTFTDTGVSLKIRNAIDKNKYPAWANETLYSKNTAGVSSNLVVAFEYKDSTGKTQYGVSNTIPVRATDNLAPGQVQVSADVYEFSLTIPSDAKDTKYRLVFRGKLGQEEDAVAVGVVNPISGFVVTPNYTSTDGISGPRAIFKQGGTWKLIDKEGLQAGNIDWKGWYVNGKPTKVLSWVGPELRYFRDVNRDNFRSEIFENGEVFDRAPAPVLGAAITKDHAGVEWVVAIVKEDIEDVAYRRLYAKSDPPDPRELWQEIGRFHAGANDTANEMTDIARTPWFFNGEGKEAQHMRIWGRSTDVPRMVRLKRLLVKINVQIDSAEFSDRDNLAGIQSTGACRSNTDSQGRTTASVNGQSKGEYILAVDYKDDKELLAKIHVDSELSTSYVTVGPSISSVNTNYYWKEYIDWGKGNILYFDQSINAAGSSGIHNAEESIEWRLNLHGLDLRHDLYAYTYFRNKKEGQVVANGDNHIHSGIEETIEGGQIDGEGISSIIVYGPNIYSDSNPRFSLVGLLPCTGNSDFNFFRYSNSNFSYSTGLPGSVAIDSGNNMAASFAYFDFVNHQIRGPFNYLSGGSLAEVIPGGPSNADYMPIGVLR